MKAFQDRIFVVGVNGGVSDGLVFEELNKIDGKEAFAHAAFAIDDGVEFLLHNIKGFWSQRCAGRACVAPTVQATVPAAVPVTPLGCWSACLMGWSTRTLPTKRLGVKL